MNSPCLRWYQPIHHKPRLGFQPADLVLGMSITKENKLQIGFAGQRPCKGI
jgi:hypothetical protein